jgi:nicotinamidase-related amidase
MAATTVAKRAVGKLRPETTAMLLVDIQERFRPLIFRGETVIHTAQYMTSVAKALDIPVVATQQYTKVFGETVKECFADQADLEATPIYEKKLFSMCTEQVSSHLAKLNKSSYIVFGIEAHVCVQQTALDLLEVSVVLAKDFSILVCVSCSVPFASCLSSLTPFPSSLFLLLPMQQGKDVHIIVDGVSSQQPLDREVALQRLSQAGAFLTTAQSAAFMLMQSTCFDSLCVVVFPRWMIMCLHFVSLEKARNTPTLRP